MTRPSPTRRRSPPTPTAEQLRGYLAHAYTATGLLIVLAATHLIMAERFALAIIALVVCVVIDATDGVLARRMRVKETARLIEGARLDDIIDYLSFVFVPLLLAVRAHLRLTPVFPTVATVLLVSVIGFSRVDAKQSVQGFFFQGFPSYWNVVADRLPVAVRDTPGVQHRAAAGTVGAGARPGALPVPHAPARPLGPSPSLPARRGLGRGLRDRQRPA